MRSLSISEPATRGDILIVERSDLIEEQEATYYTLYLGAATRVAPQWKAAPSTEISGSGSLPQTLSDTILHTIEGLLAEKLSTIQGIERILIRKDTDFFRAWVVIPDIDLAIEDQIYAAVLNFMDKFPDMPFDFAVLFRQGKDPNSIQPARAFQVYP
jgi:hypothetical protein